MRRPHERRLLLLPKVLIGFTFLSTWERLSSAGCAREYPTIEQIFAGAAQGTQPADSSLPLHRHEADKQVSQQRSMTIYERVISLSEQGDNQDDLATQL